MLLRVLCGSPALMMNALMISLDRALANPDSDAYRRHKSLADRVNSLTILVPTKTRGAAVIRDGALTVIPVYAPTPLHLISMIGAARNAAPQPDVLITQDMFLSAIIGLRLRRTFKAPVLVQSHSAVFDNPAWLAEKPRRAFLMRRLAEQVIRRADFIRTVNDHERQALIRRGFPADRLDVLPLGTASPAFRNPPPESVEAARKALEVSPDDRVILWVGYPVPFKRVHLLFEVLERVLRHQANARLILIGVKPTLTNELSALAQTRGTASHVTIMPPVPHDQLPAYYALAHVYALTSSYEGLPRVLFESGAAGLPAVGFDVPGVSEMITPDTGRLIRDGDLDGFADAVLELLNNAAVAHQLGERAQAIALSHYDAAGYPDRWVSLWKRAAEKGLR